MEMTTMLIWGTIQTIVSVMWNFVQLDWLYQCGYVQQNWKVADNGKIKLYSYNFRLIHFGINIFVKVIHSGHSIQYNKK